jgi:hypothetical protein
MRNRKTNKRLLEAANRLSAAICPMGLTYRPPWYNTMGLDERSNIIVVYVLKPRLAYKALQSILSKDKKWEGFPVVVKKMGPIRLAKEEETKEPEPAPPQPPPPDEFGAGIFD